MKYLHILLVFITLFAFSNVCNFYGVNVNSLRALSLALALLLLFLPHGNVVPSRALVLLLLLVSVETAYKLLVDGSKGSRVSALQICGTPIMLCAILRTTWMGELTVQYKDVWRFVGKSLFVFYLAIVVVAIIEGVLGHPLFGFSRASFESMAVDFTEYRSASLVGHPLQDALIVSTLMSFILVSPLRAKYKYTLWGLGYVSILLFNTRSSIVGNALLLGAYLLYTLFIQEGISMTKKISILCLTLVVVIVGLYLIFRVGMGGRLLEMGLFDDSSAQVRVDAWGMFDHVDWKQLLWGNTYAMRMKIMGMAHLSHLENYWILQIFEHGIIFMVIYVLLWYNVLRQLYKGYSWFNAIFSCGTFILISSTNNSLSTDFLFLFVFTICIIVFKEENFVELIPNKYVDNKDIDA